MDFDKSIDRVGTQCCKWDSETCYQTGEILPMWVADMDLPAPDEVVRALKKRAEHPIFGYAYDDGSFAEVLQQWILKRHGWIIDTDHIIFSPGVLTTMAMFINAVSKQGEHIIIMSPVYYPFTEYITDNNRCVDRCNLLCKDDAYQIDFEKLDELAAKENTKALLLCNPHNPVGRVFTRHELEKIAEICSQNDIKVFADEIHSDLIMPGFKHIPFATVSKEASQITVTAYSMAKTFNLAGLQASAVVVSNEKLREKILGLRRAWGLFNVNNFALTAFEAAFRYGEKYVDELVTYLDKNKKYILTFLNKRLPMLKCSELQGTYLMWMNCSSLSMTDEELAVFFREKAGLGLDEGTLFGPGGEQHMRINIACPLSRVKEAMERLEKAVKEGKET
ncbi:pyridoxal phosphate-dependent aminotransferase [Mediterraneibacter sp. NSJ-55]|uniref:cysteine-S-conjugate beta-lyase n=1 Tax=Mediterraneibacter hominis TaxID=2763054 RepID=A0A923RRE3_9FIRM|nr:MalY/PatB family protein [Mediterraneibacter hominis]MBC5689613.1 pyridoxal phosphate-dependent aminotransferase [Mediterraneibacter hominis]